MSGTNKSRTVRRKTKTTRTKPKPKTKAKTNSKRRRRSTVSSGPRRKRRKGAAARKGKSQRPIKLLKRFHRAAVKSATRLKQIIEQRGGKI